MRITQADLLDALRDALAKPAIGEGATVTEIMDATGASEEKVRAALRAVAAEGRLEVLRVKRTILDGRTMPLPGYRLKGKR